MRIGVAGCGAMGLPMARALCKSGFDVRGFDIRPLGDTPLKVSKSIREFTDGLETLFSVVRDIPQTEALLFGEQALIHTAKNLRFVVISSTLAPEYLTHLRQKIPPHIEIVDAPMSGAPIAARESRLSFMLGGPPDCVELLMPLFKAMGTDIHHIGTLGAGMTAKVLNNFVAASSVCATRLVLARAESSGITSDTMRKVLNSSSGQSWFSSNFEKIDWAKEGYDDTNTMAILAKDVRSALSIMKTDGENGMGETLDSLLHEFKPLE